MCKKFYKGSENENKNLNFLTVINTIVKLIKMRKLTVSIHRLVVFYF